MISTHTPHARRDLNFRAPFAEIAISTHTPHARRDNKTQKLEALKAISTHTPHARRDLLSINSLSQCPDFNSHASCEA